MILYYDALQNIEENMPVDVPNDQYDPNRTLISTLSSISDVDNFCNAYNHDNKYNGLKLGQRIKISAPSIYDYRGMEWYIAGFDCEYNHTASDGSVKDNGYGILLIPTDCIIIGSTMTFDYNSSGVSVPYINSTMHTYELPRLANLLQSTLGSHLVNRNVLLSSSLDSNSVSSSYTWTTSHITLPSVTQLIGGFPLPTICNKYDIGEANYHIPLYKYTSYCEDCRYISSYNTFITRAVTSPSNYSKGRVLLYTNGRWQNQSGNNTWVMFDPYLVNCNCPIRPLIYIR